MKYDFELNEWASNDSLSKIIKRLKSNSKILEFGCANGRLTKYMAEKLNCTVNIVEIDEEAGKEAAKYAQNSLLGLEDGNIETLNWVEKLKGEKFDFIIFADVLEHLRDPEEILMLCKGFLNTYGSIIVSIPNIGNNSILASLYNNEFEYQKIGLLDNTHIKFYTYNTFKRMLGRLDFKMTYESGTFNKIGENEIPVDFNSIVSPLRKLLPERPFGDVYQFIFEFRNMNIEDDDIYALESVFPKNAVSYYESVYYMKHNDNTVSEFDTVRLPVRLGINRHILDLKEKEVSSIRFDPIDTSCIVKIVSIIGTSDSGNMLEITSCNSLTDNDNLYVFKDNDPFFEFDVNGDVLEVIFELIDIDLESELVKTFEVKLKEDSLKYERKCIEYENKQVDMLNQYETNLKKINLEYNNLLVQRNNDIENFKVQEQMLTRNDSDIRMLNEEIERLREEVQRLESENISMRTNIERYNSKFYHLNKIK